MLFIETTKFSALADELFGDDELIGLQWHLMSRPDAGDVTDDYGGYNRVPARRRQLRWARQLRHFAAMGERVGRGGPIGQRLALIGRAVVRTRHRFERGQIGEHEHRRRQDRLRRRFVLELERGSRLRLDGRTKRQCAHLLKRESMLWTFVEDERVPLTNNLAERTIRPFVMGRSLCTTSSSV